MSRTWQIALFILGATVFGYLVAQIGVAQLAADAASTGWMFVPIVALYALVFACSTVAWRLIMADDAHRPSYWRTYVTLVCASSLNFLTPLVNAGGEPYRAAAMAPWLGKRRAAGSVILHRLLHSFAYVLIWLSAVILAFVMLPPHTRPVVYLLLGVAGVLLLGVLGLFLSAHRRGLLERILNRMHRVPLIRGLAVLLEPRRALLVELDNQITEFYHRHPQRFIKAVALEYLGRCLFMIELLLIAASLGIKLGYFRAFAIGGLEAILNNAMFVVPFELGAREGAFYVLFKLFGLDPQLGIYTSIVGRVRDFAWIAAGLLLIWVTTSVLAAAPAAPAAPAATAARSE
ncbi:MAG TPA: lysylphosphatidylglycerol synthase transmembrane domain-containing protein [Gemmatimonadales bacterium]|nr:lysylphosphatidylglycerol synthase transmembrane domain-containing protein [Gemmatimonadales bacterium]